MVESYVHNLSLPSKSGHQGHEGRLGRGARWASMKENAKSQKPREAACSLTAYRVSGPVGVTFQVSTFGYDRSSRKLDVFNSMSQPLPGSEIYCGTIAMTSNRLCSGVRSWAVTILQFTTARVFVAVNLQKHIGWSMMRPNRSRAPKADRRECLIGFV